MTKLTLVLGAAVVGAGSIAVWIATLPKQAAIEEPSSTSANVRRQRRAQEFFGGRQEYDLEGGQVMRPRWE